MDKPIDRRGTGVLAWLLLLLGVMVAFGGAASAGSERGGLATDPDVYTVVPFEPETIVTRVFGALDGPQVVSDPRVQITNLSEQLYVVDLPSMGVRAIPGSRPVLAAAEPDSGAVGLLGAYMSVSPDVISQSIPSGFGAVSSNWLPSEMVAVSLNGGAPTNYAASATGRLGQIFNVGGGLGYITIEARGLTSGRQTGGVVEIRDAGPPVPGLAVAPHAINPNGSSNINVLGTRYQANNSSISLARNGTVINTLTSGASGSFYYQINVAASADTSAVYSTYTSTVGSRAGQSIEERADAGVPPAGDQNVVKALVDRPIVPTAGGTVAIVGTGFSPGEGVTVSGCGSLSLTADANGAVRFFNGVSGSGAAQCVLTGGTTGRIGRASMFVASNAINAPGIIAAPEAVVGTGTFTLVIDRLLPNQAGTVYVDGAAQGNLSTDANGKAAALVNKPSSGFIHAVRWVGSSGQSVSAPLLYLPAGGTPTPTRTSTRTPTMTFTASPTSPPTNTATWTPTNTPPPTQTPGGFTATPIPTSTTEPSSTPVISSPTPTECPIQFTDVPEGSTFYEFVRCLACRDIVGGYSTNPPCVTGVPCFLPGNNVTRGQMAKFVSNAAGYSDPIPPSQQTFTDVPTGSTFWEFVERVYLHNIVGGYNASPPCVTGVPCFLPGNNVTRGQIAKFVSNAAGYSDPIPPSQQTFTDVAPLSTFWEVIERVYRHGVVAGYDASPPCTTGVPCFLPGNNVTRGQTAKFISNAFFPGCLGR